MSEYNRHKFAMEWMHGGGRDPNGRSLDEEIKIGKEDWLERQRVATIGPNPTFAPQEIEMPNWRDLIREEGVQVGEQVAQGGRIGLQSGQLVQPGPGRQGYNGLKRQATNIGEQLPKKIQNFLIETFDDVEFDFKPGQRYGVSKLDDVALHSKIQNITNNKIANPDYVYTPTGTDLSKHTYEKGWGTGKQLLEKARLKGIDAKEGRAASIFADNFDIKSKPNPLKKQNQIYDLTVLDDPQKVEKIIKKQVAVGKATKEATDKYLSQDIKLAKKREQQLKKMTAVKEYSVPSIETGELKGTKAVHLSHMDDIYTQFTTGQNLGYAPDKINREFLTSFDNKFKQLYKKRDRLLKEKPKDLIKQLEQINITGARLSGETGGYKSFKFVDPYTLKPYQFGVDAAKTIDPLGILEGKTIQAASGAADPTAKVSKKILDLSPVDRYFFEKNRKAVFAAQKKLVNNSDATIKLLKRMGYGKGCKASGGRVGFADAGAVTGELECILNDVKKTKADLNSPTKEVRTLAVLKNKKATQVAEKIPEILKILRRGGQRAAAGISSIIGGYAGLALEGVIEGAIFEWYKREGYTDKQAYAETFTPRLLAEGVAGKSTEDVPWYGGAEELLEKELIGTNEVVQRYVDNEKALAEAEAKYLQLDTDYKVATSGKGGSTEKGEKYKKGMENTSQEINRIEDQLDLDRDTYNAAKEKQETEMGVRAIEYGEYGEGDTPKLAKEREERRHKEFLDYRKGKQRSFYLPKGKLHERVEDPLAETPYTFLKTDETLPAFSLGPGMYFPWEEIPRYKGDEGKKRKWQDIYDAGGWDLMDKIGIAGGVANMAEGGIASLKKK